MDEEEVIEKITTFAQRCFQQCPVVVLGSGASAVHGFKDMSGLAGYLIDNIVADGGEENVAWERIKSNLKSGNGLEEALHEISAPETLVGKIVKLTWHAIAEDDLKLMARASLGKEHFSLSRLLRGMFRSTHMYIDIVTPNYDRVAEYASDTAGYFHTTGFVPGIIRRREGRSPVSFRQGTNQARTIRIWKVHGSLDWFADASGHVVSIPISGELPDGLEPQIVTPGVSKYERTHDEPFRSAIQGADSASDQSASFLCVGYGFRDRHIQPKIVEKCRQSDVPIMILARALTDETMGFLADGAGRAYMALEKDGNGTRMFSPEFPGGTTVAQPDLWTLDGFNSMVA